MLPELGERDVRIWKDAEIKVDVNDDTANRGNGSQHHWMALSMQGQFGSSCVILLYTIICNLPSVVLVHYSRLLSSFTPACASSKVK